jgi:cytochrome P450
VLNSFYTAGSDTVRALLKLPTESYPLLLQTQAAALWLFSVLALHPDVQRRAQAEVDVVTRGERLPTYEDHNSTPYLNGFVKEVWRWSSLAGLGVYRVQAPPHF